MTEIRDHTVRTELRWFAFTLHADDGALVGAGRMLASSPTSAKRGAECFLAGTRLVRLEELERSTTS